MDAKPNCYKCLYRGTIPGDAHSRCRHPEVRATGIEDCFMGGLAEAVLGKMDGVRLKLDVQFGAIGGGGPTWPANFNPAFLTACRGFKPREEKSCQR